MYDPLGRISSNLKMEKYPYFHSKSLTKVAISSLAMITSNRSRLGSGA
jgi:hypothetical protein